MGAVFPSSLIQLGELKLTHCCCVLWVHLFACLFTVHGSYYNIIQGWLTQLVHMILQQHGILRSLIQRIFFPFFLWWSSGGISDYQGTQEKANLRQGVKDPENSAVRGIYREMAARSPFQLFIRNLHVRSVQRLVLRQYISSWNGWKGDPISVAHSAG